MPITHITHNVPADRVDFLIAVAEASGGRLVSRTVEPDGEFTLVFAFPDGSTTSIAHAAMPEVAFAEESGTNTPTAASAVSGDSDPAWLRIARQELGQSERLGTADNPRIVEYHASTASGPDHDAVPWCASFVNWCVEQAGLKGSDSKLARSWLGWGEPINTPRPGCLVVLERGPAPQGHVGFFVGATPGFVRLLGGNQGDRVSIDSFSAERVIGLRWPSTR